MASEEKKSELPRPYRLVLAPSLKHKKYPMIIDRISDPITDTYCSSTFRPHIRVKETRRIVVLVSAPGTAQAAAVNGAAEWLLDE